MRLSRLLEQQFLLQDFNAPRFSGDALGVLDWWLQVHGYWARYRDWRFRVLLMYEKRIVLSIRTFATLPKMSRKSTESRSQIRKCPDSWITNVPPLWRHPFAALSSPPFQSRIFRFLSLTVPFRLYHGKCVEISPQKYLCTLFYWPSVMQKLVSFRMLKIVKQKVAAPRWWRWWIVSNRSFCEAKQKSVSKSLI